MDQKRKFVKLLLAVNASGFVAGILALILVGPLASIIGFTAAFFGGLLLVHVAYSKKQEIDDDE